MSHLIRTASRFENNNQVAQLSSIINRRSIEKPRLCVYDVSACNLAKLDSEIIALEFCVEDDGFYSISSQVALKCNVKSNVFSLQVGICSRDYNDVLETFDSRVLNGIVEAGHILSTNLATHRELLTSKKYILWFALDSSDNSHFSLMENSRLSLIKI